jgi:DNA polymerase
MMHDRLIKDKQALFFELVKAAQNCQKCEDLCERKAVLSELNGDVNANVLFIAEAPGRNGGDRTRVPLVGDASGANFAKFIDSINLSRAEVFVTNSVLCNPRKSSGANRKPTKQEIASCSSFLQRQIDVLDPIVVVTLGSVALEAIKTIERHELNLRNDAGKISKWNNKLLVPLYHPSPQVLASHRRMNEQLEDYKAVQRAILKANE